ncbi:MAG: hypothetical protein C6H99_07535 [Epsilonproteobacteria bacterium]|nr:hypothetical protein [Campylobacterota bacterium]NPA64335.1 hypothetical protein [Campylobacterota bacterium]
MRRLIWVAALAALMGGCGYKPIKHYTRSAFEGGVYTQVKVYLRDPQNAVLIKDAVKEAVMERFGGHLANRRSAATAVDIKIKRLFFTPLEYDKNGYVVYYRTKVIMEFDLTRGQKSQRITTSGFYDFAIEPNSVISDTLRFIAIRESAKKAIDRFISRVAYMEAR